MAEATTTAPPTSVGDMPRLKQQYVETVRSRIMEDLGLANPMLIPNLEKIVVNMGIGEAVGDRKQAGAAMDDLATIAGQCQAVVQPRFEVPAPLLPVMEADRGASGIGSVWRGISIPIQAETASAARGLQYSEDPLAL